MPSSGRRQHARRAGSPRGRARRQTAVVAYLTLGGAGSTYRRGADITKSDRPCGVRRVAGPGTVVRSVAVSAVCDPPLPSWPWPRRPPSDRGHRGRSHRARVVACPCHVAVAARRAGCRHSRRGRAHRRRRSPPPVGVARWSRPLVLRPRRTLRYRGSGAMAPVVARPRGRRHGVGRRAGGCVTAGVGRHGRDRRRPGSVTGRRGHGDRDGRRGTSRRRTAWVTPALGRGRREHRRHHGDVGRPTFAASTCRCDRSLLLEGPARGA